MDWIGGLVLIPAYAVAVTGGLLVVLDDRRLILATLAVQYAFVAWLAAVSLPLSVAAVKLVSGVVACALMAVTFGAVGWRASGEPSGALPAGHAFRWIAALLVLIVAFAIGRDGWGAIPALGPGLTLGAMFLLALGLLQIGITEDALRVGAGILTLLSGFEVAYAAIEPSLAVVALLASVHLGVALIISYLLVGIASPAAPKDGSS